MRTGQLCCVMLMAMRRWLSLLLLSATLAAAQQSEPERLFNSAVSAQQRGDYTSAIHDYEKLLQMRPNMGEVRANLGAALVHAGRLDEGITQYRLALASVAEKDQVRMNLALAYYKKGDLADAIHEFDELRKVRPRDPQLAILLGDSEVRMGQANEAVTMLAPLEAENDANPDFEYVLGTALIQAGKRREGVARLDKTAQATQSADAYLLAGSTLLDLNDNEHARSDLEAALRLNPKLPRVYTLTGMARDKNGDAAAAEPAFREALKLNPGDFEANLYLGAILYKRRAVDEAKPYLDRALELNPSSSMARYELAMWKSTAGQYESAAKELEAIVKSDPDWLEPHVQLATVYYRLHRADDGARERAIVDRLTAQQQSRGPGKQ